MTSENKEQKIDKAFIPRRDETVSEDEVYKPPTYKPVVWSHDSGLCVPKGGSLDLGRLSDERFDSIGASLRTGDPTVSSSCEIHIGKRTFKIPADETPTPKIKSSGSKA